MSDDKEKTPDQEAVEDVIKGTPVASIGAGLPRLRLGDLGFDQADTPLPLRSADYTPLTLTSVASASAELFSPDQAPMIKAYQEAIAKADKGDVFMLSTGKVTPNDVGIETDLEYDISQTYAGFELGERQNKDTQAHEVKVARIGARGPM